MINMIKVELFGITKTDDNQQINIFFKTPKRFVYQLMFMKKYKTEYVDFNNNIQEEYKNIIKGAGVDFSLYHQKDTTKYSIRTFRYNVEKTNCSFKTFFDYFICYKPNLYERNHIVELYEFLFSELFEELTNEKNIYYMDVRAKQLLKILKKGDL